MKYWLIVLFLFIFCCNKEQYEEWHEVEKLSEGKVFFSYLGTRQTFPADFYLITNSQGIKKVKIIYVKPSGIMPDD